MLELLGTNPGANKRDLAKLLGLKGSDRIHLKRVLKELEQDGAIAGNKKRGLTRKGELPDIAVLEITGTDDDGEYLARPLQWDGDEAPPAIYLIPPKDGGAPAKGARLGAAGTGGRALRGARHPQAGKRGALAPAGCAARKSEGLSA